MLSHETFNLDEDQHHNFKDPEKHFCNCLLKCLITFNYTQQAPFPCWNNSWGDTLMPHSLDQVILLGTMLDYFVRGETSWDNYGKPSKLLSGFFPLRGELPPNSAKGFWAEWFSVKGGRGRGYPPIPPRKIPLKSRYFRFENSFFCLFMHF